MYFIFLHAVNRRSLEESRNFLKRIEAQEELRFLEELRIEDPKIWIKRMRAALIERHGHLPAVDTSIDFLRKLELELPRTDDDCRTYIRAYQALYGPSGNSLPYEFYAFLEAANQVGHLVGDEPPRRLEKYRKARAEGISFYDIEWDND